jgi:hypothetical protein
MLSLQHVLGFGLRIFLTFFVFLGVVLLGSITARSEEGFRLFLEQAEPVFENVGSFQMRVEQRVIIRVPRIRQTSTSSLTMGTLASPQIKYNEKKIGKCVNMDRFVASRPGAGSKEFLELVTRDGSMIRAYLGDGCLAREFYAGAYMERPHDGRLCVDRDLMHARTGAKCEIDKFRLLVQKK